MFFSVTSKIIPQQSTARTRKNVHELGWRKQSWATLLYFLLLVLGLAHLGFLICEIEITTHPEKN